MKKIFIIVSVIVGIFFSFLRAEAEHIYFKDSLVIKELETGFDVCHTDDVCEYTNVELESFNNGTEVIIKKENDKYDLISKSFVTIVKDADEIININHHFSKSSIRDIGVKKDGKYGILRYDKNEESVEQLYPYEYEDLILAPPDTFFLKKDDKWGMIQDGEIKANFIYDNIEYMGKDNFHRYYKTESGNLYGYIEVDSRNITDAVYKDVKLKQKGKSVFPQVKEKKLWHYPDDNIKKDVAYENRQKIKQGAMYVLCLPIIIPVLVVMF